ncbi:MAG: cytochrome-c peroxidase, partial [Bacteroidota bacterium]
MAWKYLCWTAFFVCSAFYSSQIQLVYPSSFPRPTYDFSRNPLNEATIELGRKLFYDPILSRD